MHSRRQGRSVALLFHGVVLPTLKNVMLTSTEITVDHLAEVPSSVVSIASIAVRSML